MTLVSKLRPVTVDGVVYSVPTNVIWATHKRAWMVSVRSGELMAVENFYPEHHGDDRQKALEAAAARADVLRNNPAAPKMALERPLSRRRLGDNSVLPKGISVERRPDRQGNPVYQLVVYKANARYRTIRIGPVASYTQEQYDQALARALSALTEVSVAPETAQAVVTHQVASQLTAALLKYNVSKKKLYDDLASA